MAPSLRVFSSLSNTSNRFCVAVGLFRSQTQEMNKCGKNRSETLSGASCATFFILATFWTHLWSITEQDPQQHGIYLSTLYTLTSVCIFSILFSIHFQRGWQGEFVSQSRAVLVGDHLFYSHDFHVWFKGDIVRRNWMLVILKS